ncbi:MAG TPA: SPOR domain-containing protein [Saprospiraceae bacterium]|nr:SPOR domain-containing protein [Saprospiraceae bacterium]
MRILVFILFIISSQISKAQVVIKEDPDVNHLMNRFIESNRAPDKTLGGYRIQVVATVDRRKLESSKKAIQSDFPQYPISTVYNDPYYKLRLGAFMNKNEAQAALNKVKIKYPGAYLAQDNLKATEVTK